MRIVLAVCEGLLMGIGFVAVMGTTARMLTGWVDRIAEWRKGRA